MTSIIYPTSTTNVSDTFNDHMARGSVNPGTDYTCSYGSKVFSVSGGVVTSVGTNNSGSGGRVIHVNHDDGSGADYLHLAEVHVRKGDRVYQGTQLGLSGASGNGKDWYYGPHLHISYRNNHYGGFGNVGNLDFDALVRMQPASVDVRPIETMEEEVKYFVGGVVTDKPGTIMFGGPGIIPIPIPGSIWQGVLTRYADAMNEKDDNERAKKLVFTSAEWKLIRQATSALEPSDDLSKAIDLAGM